MELITKTIPIIRDLSLNPTCAHGPTIMFQRDKDRFFACSAYRCKKLCPFYMTEDQWKRCSDKKCLTDDSLSEQAKKKRKLEATSNPLVDPHQDNKGQAQYHFSPETTQFFIGQLEKLGFDSVLCVGTPSLHEEFAKTSIRSFLLDIDIRFVNMHKKMCLYNMCNHHFFNDPSKYKKFLKKSKKLAVILDPPFGVKPELIWHGCLRGIQTDICTDEKEKLDFDVFWIFPYFNEGHILKCSESLNMSDYHVEYSNHSKYKRSGNSNKKASPIRVFTTIPLSKLELPEESYRFCKECSKWVDKRNKHCPICSACTTKDGGPSYSHCNVCEKCVKPTWNHCRKCSVCHLKEAPCKRQISEVDSGHHTKKKKKIL